MTVCYKFSHLKLKPVSPTTESDTDIWQSVEGNQVQEVKWSRLTNKPETWGCRLIFNQFSSVDATVEYRLLRDYALLSQQQKKQRETWVWLASVTMTDDEVTQTLADSYYFFNLKEAQGYCETAALMICEKLGIPFPGVGASILVDRSGHPITRHCQVVLGDATEVIASDFSWYKFYLECTDSNFKHSPLGYVQVRPTVKYLDALHQWQSVPCCEVLVKEV